MLRNWSLVVIIVSALTISLILGVVSANLKHQIVRVHSLWELHYQQASARDEHLDTLRQSFGYGGFIHHYKNYILRRSDHYIPLIDQSLRDARSAIRKLTPLLTNADNKSALAKLLGVLVQYEDKYAILKQRVREQPALGASELDSLVRVNDEPAYKALTILSSSFSMDLASITQQTDQQLQVAERRLQQYQLIVIPLVYLAAFICVVYVLRTNRAYTKLKAIFSSTPDALVVIDNEGKIIQYNDNALALFGYSEEQFKRLSIDDLVPGGAAKGHKQLREGYIEDSIKPALESGKFNDVMGMSRSKREFKAKTQHGDLVPVEVGLTGFLEGNKLRILAVVKDLTQKKELEFAAHNDSLTGLANRLSAETLLKQELHRAKRYGRDLAVIMLDLDHFKQINDNHGHGVGDKALASVANVLSRHVRSSDLAARFGGEEFVLIYPETDLDSVFTIAEAIRFDVEALQVPPIEKITASLGVAVYRGEDGINTIDMLLKSADEALYQAKENGRNQVSIKQNKPT